MIKLKLQIKQFLKAISYPDFINKIEDSRSNKLDRDKLQANKGFGLVEILVASAIISASLVALVVTVQLSFRIVDESVRKKQAEFLAEEGIEVVRILRDTSWSSNIAPLLSNTTYYPSFVEASSMWTLATSNPGEIDGLFSQTIVFRDVYRKNIDDDIVASTSIEAKTLDVGTKHITSLVTWDSGGKQVEFNSYTTDLFQN